jgi:hypothetical protein
MIERCFLVVELTLQLRESSLFLLNHTGLLILGTPKMPNAYPSNIILFPPGSLVAQRTDHTNASCNSPAEAGKERHESSTAPTVLLGSKHIPTLTYTRFADSAL